jgi:two-component system sensor histidine kinase GlrK
LSVIASTWGLGYASRMRQYYPRSFLKLLLVGFTLVALPLAAAVVTSALAVNSLANRSQAAVYQAVQGTQISRQLSESLTAMERSARQLLILGDRAVLGAYNIARSQFLLTVAQVRYLPFDAEQRGDLDAIVGGEQQIYEALSDGTRKPPQLQAAVVRFVDLSQRAQNIMARSNQLIDHEVEAMGAAAERAQRIMLWQSFALVPIVIFLVVGFAVLISRPIAEIETAIRELGSGRFNTPVVVNGPQDLAYLGERLDWMRRQLLGLEQQKNRFLQQVSHELKTPLTALREGAQLLSDNVVGKLTPAQREIAEIVRHNSIELQRRIEELLSYGAIQSHKLSLELETIDARELLESAVQSHKLALQAKDIVLQNHSSAVSLRADPEKLRVVFDNLLSNAIKFSPAGAAITLKLAREQESLVVDVIDEGPGIAADDLPNIFEPFYQGRVQGSAPVRGTGLGLSIVKEYVAAHGGTVEVVPGTTARGAHLRVRVPLEQATSA